MRLISTRLARHRSTFTEAVQSGLAPDGGLWIPEPIACFRDISTLLTMHPAERGLEILSRLLGDEFTRDELAEGLIDAFDIPAPLVPVGRQTYALELFHGPTLAFKDFGARMLARLLALVIRREGGGLRTVLTATSGDTGAAAAHAFYRQRGIRVVVLYPKGRVSPLQERLFATLGENILAYEVDGTFDDCQALVKGCFHDADLVRTLRLTSANSLNLARLLGQIPYFFEAVAQLRALSFREPPVIAVPCGNFGNLTAGLLAQRMGLPVRAFVVATNANDTVPRFLDGGAWEPRPAQATLSNAMDVAEPSNWERIQALHGFDPEALRRTLRWGSLTDEETRQALWELRGVGYGADPHAAVAYGVLRQRMGLKETGIFLGTAHPAKFREVLQQQMNETIPLPDALAAVQDRPLLSRPLPNDLEALKAELRA